MMSSTILDQCASFEWRGPYLSLSRVQHEAFNVLRPRTDWSDVVGDRPLIDNRNSELADLFPKPRVMLERIMGQLDEQQGDGPSRKPRGLRA